MTALRGKRFWTVAETAYQAEWRAKRNLSEQGFCPYLPIYREHRTLGGVRRVLPLFPRYIIVETDKRTNWRAIASTRGVIRLMLTAEQKPAMISDEDIGRIRAMENDEGYVVVEGEEPPVFALQDQVTALTGAFRGQRGEYRGQTERRNHCSVLFSMLGREFEYEMLERHLAAA